MSEEIIKGFSALSKEEKLQFVVRRLSNPNEKEQLFHESMFKDEKLRNSFLELSENSIGSYHMPYSIAPNFLVDGKVYHVPMVTEESSVVAAASF